MPARQIWEVSSMDSGFLVPAVLFLVCLAIRSAYELLKDANRVDLDNKLLFAFIFTSMCVLWISWFSLCPADPLHADFPVWLRWTGFGIFVGGTILSVGALVQLRGLENIDHLVTTGLFTKLRHPMYVGFLAWIVGWSIYHGALLSFTIGALGIISVLWWRHLEEVRLALQFGSDYQKYKVTTWF
jgi:protein-S-isoprenylcysteine O-methyltransferase Ste14